MHIPYLPEGRGLLLPRANCVCDYENVGQQRDSWHSQGKLTQHLCERQVRVGADAHPNACEWLGAFALTKDGSGRRVKDTGGLTKMAGTNVPQEEQDVQPHRKVWAEHLKLRRAEKHQNCHKVCLPGGLPGASAMKSGGWEKMVTERAELWGPAWPSTQTREGCVELNCGWECWAAGFCFFERQYFWVVFWNWSGKAERGDSICFGVFLKGARLNGKSLPLFQTYTTFT